MARLPRDPGAPATAAVTQRTERKGYLVTHLSALGERICILGPSGSGKSTLAQAIARKQGSVAIHLDQFYHAPGTDWVPRPEHEFRALHDAAIAAERWVMDGNYSTCMPQRFRRATGLVLLDVPAAVSLFRYVRRTLFETRRHGDLEGARAGVRWFMVRHIVLVSPGNRRRYREMAGRVAIPVVVVPSARSIGRCYGEWGLER